MTTIRLLVVDDHVIFREGLRALLDMEDDFDVAAEASTGKEAIELAYRESPDVALLDLHLPDGNGADVCREIRRVSPDCKVLILTAYDADGLEDIACRAGHERRRHLVVGVDRLAENIRAVYRGEVLLSPSVASTVVRQLSRLRAEADRTDEVLSTLTPREQEVFELASQGLKNIDIAAQLYLSEKTIKTHLRNIYNKLGVASKADLRLYAVKMGHLPAD